MITPNIIKETCEGTACIPIRDALFRHREIYCTGEIDAETANMQTQAANGIDTGDRKSVV